MLGDRAGTIADGVGRLREGACGLFPPVGGNATALKRLLGGHRCAGGHGASGTSRGDCPHVGSHRFGALRFHLVVSSDAGVSGVPSVLGSCSSVKNTCG